MAYVPAGETRPQECLAMTRRWLKDEATIEEVKAAKAAARAAKAAAEAAAWAAEAAAEAAAWAATWAAEAAAWAAEAAEAAAWAAEAAEAAAWAAKAAAGAESLRFSADLCRKYIEVQQ
jgi:hypothetical protein